MRPLGSLNSACLGRMALDWMEAGAALSATAPHFAYTAHSSHWHAEQVRAHAEGRE